MKTTIPRDAPPSLDCMYVRSSHPKESVSLFPPPPCRKTQFWDESCDMFSENRKPQFGLRRGGGEVDWGSGMGYDGIWKKPGTLQGYSQPTKELWSDELRPSVPLMSRIERKYCLNSTSYLTGVFPRLLRLINQGLNGEMCDCETGQ